MAEEQVPLHPTVQAIAKSFVVEKGKLVMQKAVFDGHAKTMKALSNPDEKKAVLVSLMALTSRFLREGEGGADMAAETLAQLAAIIVGDPAKTKALFAQVK